MFPHQVVDGGHSHTFRSPLPYPESVLEPHKVSSMFNDPREAKKPASSSEGKL
jgi:hypothetical protein